MGREIDMFTKDGRCIIVIIPSLDVNFTLTNNDYGINFRADKMLDARDLPSDGINYIGELYIKNSDIHFNAFDTLFYTLDSSAKKGEIDLKYFKDATEFQFTNDRDPLGAELKLKRRPEGYYLSLTKPVKVDKTDRNVFDDESLISVDIEDEFDNFETRKIYRAFSELFDNLGAIKGIVDQAPGYEIKKVPLKKN